MKEELTGRRRHVARRIGRWSKQTILVLQIERRWLHTYCIAGLIDSDWIVDWRDAHVGDLTVEGSEK